MQQETVKRAERVATDLKSSCLGLRIGRLNRIVGRRFDQALRPLGLSVAQMEVLGVLTLQDGPVRPADLATWLSVERSTISRNLALMEQRGYVRTAETSPAGRSQRVVITPDGLSALARAEQAWRDTQSQIAAQLGPDAVATLNTWLASVQAD